MIMIGIKLLDKIHGFWKQLQIAEEKKRFIIPTDSIRDEIMDLKRKIELCWEILDSYHEGTVSEIDDQMNYTGIDYQ